MARGTYISINTAKIGGVSAQAGKLGGELDTTRAELTKLQNELSKTQNILDIYFRFCSSDVIPTKRLQKQKSKMEEIVSLLAQAEQLAKDADNKLNTKTNALKLAVTAMYGLTAAGYTTAVSVITKALTGETDCGDDYTYVGQWPVSPLSGNPKITSHYGKRKNNYHHGVDFGVGIGTQVKAPVGGTVLKAYTQSGGGKVIYILGDDGYLYEFAHLSKWQCKTGDRVEAGDNIALSGATGSYCYGAHLHFGVFKADKAVKNNKLTWKQDSLGDWYLPGSVDPEKFFLEYGIEL